MAIFYLLVLSLQLIPLATATECREIPLISGTENRVCDSDLTASSEWPDLKWDCRPRRSRLFTKESHGYSGSWVATVNQANQWIQVDFRKEMQVTAVATQGRNTHSQWVTSYVIQYSDNGHSWKSYKHGTATKRFIGNWNTDSVHKHQLHSPFKARCVRLFPQAWHGHISLRWELYGCPVPGGSPRNCGHESCVKQCKNKYLG